MSIPDYQSLMLPLLRCVADGEKPVQFTIRSLADELQLAPEDLEATLPGGTPVFSSRVQWAGTYLVQATLLARPRRGVLQVTERGRSVLAEGPQKIDNELLSRFPEFNAFRQRSRSPREKENETVPVARQESQITSLMPPEERIVGAQ